ncbi:MAG: prohibitin family protein [Anaerolineae bacterium]|nr:prohibitin family protein [Anaerolineae bacterium]
MVFASLLGVLATVVWVAVIGYVVFVFAQRARGRPSKVSISITVVLVLLALLFSTLSAGVVVIDAREVGVVFNDIYGLRPYVLTPGLHIITPFIDHVYRYPTIRQSYTMSIAPQEGAQYGDDSLWSRTIDGQQVSIDATVFFEIDPGKAPLLHSKWQNRYLSDFVRPTVRGVTRAWISQYRVEEVYSLRREELRSTIKEELRKRFEEEGLILRGFLIRNVNFTDEYANAIEQKQIAEQEAQRMKYIVEKERLEAERKAVEAEGIKQAAIIKAQGEAEALRLINESLRQNRDLLLYRYIEKIAPNIQVLMLPSSSPFILDPGTLLQSGGVVSSTATVTP